ncbi:uncharacterized protein LOC120352621 [Nilaparvata lugens]|uniref:uncharacterized protein LOC120352621 n=1 Tax=Nilaparvata lugens TaxID=108931 RepID=UPI00193E291E|nr:uncharacterized protein LOC120352621 [Nilaparvata lugens]
MFAIKYDTSKQVITVSKMKLGLFIFPILVFFISVFAVGGASPAADDEAQMLEEMMDELTQAAAQARHVRSSEVWERSGVRQKRQRRRWPDYGPCTPGKQACWRRPYGRPVHRPSRPWRRPPWRRGG